MMERYEKEVVQVLNPFLSFVVSFQKAKTHNMLCMMLDPCYKSLGLTIQIFGKERTWQTTGEYDHWVLLSLHVSTYNFFNPNDVGSKILNSTSHIIEITSLLYNLMKIDEEMAS